jgi:hypothetical protein
MFQWFKEKFHTNKINNIKQDIKNNEELNNLEIQSMQKKHENHKKKTWIKQEKRFQKTKLLNLILFLGACFSTGMTIVGTRIFNIVKVNNIEKILFMVNPVIYSILVLVLIFIQVLAFYGSSILTWVEAKFHVHATKLKFIVYVCLFVSIGCNFNFLNKYILVFSTDYSNNFLHILFIILNSIICLMLCIAFDMCITVFYRLKSDMNNYNFTNKKKINLQDNESFLSMFWFNLTFKHKARQLNKYKQNIDEFNKLTQTTPDNVIVTLDENIKQLDKPRQEIKNLDHQEKNLDNKENEPDNIYNTLNNARQNETQTTLDHEIPIDTLDNLDNYKNTQNLDNQTQMDFKMSGPTNNLDRLQEKNVDKSKPDNENSKPRQIEPRQNKTYLDKEKEKEISLDEKYKTVKSIVKDMKDNERLQKQTFTKKLALINETEWRKIRELLKKDNIIYIDEKKLIYKKPNKEKVAK